MNKIKLLKKDILIIFSVSILFLFLSVSSAYKSPIFADEPNHMSSGYSKLRLNDFRINTEAPPLINMLSAFPLTFLDLNAHEDSDAWKQKNMVEYSCNFLYKNNEPARKLTFFARLPTIVLGLVLGLFIFYFVALRYGLTVAHIIFFIYATHPMILAHSSVIYIDFGFLFFNFFTFVSLLLFLDTKKTKYLYAFFVLFSITFLTKFTSLHNFIFYPLTLLLNIKRLMQWIKNNKEKILVHIIAFAAIFYAILLVSYGFDKAFMPLKTNLYEDQLISPEDPKYTEALALLENNKLLGKLAELPNPLPYPFIKGIGYWVFDKRTQERELFSSVNTLLLKNTLPIILLLAFYLYLVVSKRRNTKGFNYDLNYIYYIVFYVLMFNVLGSYSLARYVLMVYPFIILLLAKPISTILNLKISNNYIVALLFVLLAAHFISVISYYPAFYEFNCAFKFIFGPAAIDLPISSMHLYC
jgi:4-amino-4-deoxy-L-arabinose transferase-like glycosyltransferase